MTMPSYAFFEYSIYHEWQEQKRKVILWVISKCQDLVSYGTFFKHEKMILRLIKIFADIW